MTKNALIPSAVLCAFFLSLSGCVNVNANVDANGWSGKLSKKLDKTAATSTARDKASSEGFNPKLYKTNTVAAREEGSWWVYFDALDPDNTTPVHFRVYVDADGKATMYREQR